MKVHPSRCKKLPTKRNVCSNCQKLIRKIKRVTPEPSTSTFDILPDAILTIILTCLPFKEAVRSRILSRRWRYLWSPNLVFELVNKSACRMETDVTEFVKPVNQVMALHQDQGPSVVDELIIRLWGTQITGFRPHDLFGFPQSSASVPRRNSCTSLINLICDWISFAMQKKVRVFELGSYGDNNKQPVVQMGTCFCQTGKCYFYYNFPDLEKFLSISRAMQPKASLVSLKSFRLINININDGMIEYLLSSCPLLEELCITGSEYLSNLNIASTSLKSLRLCNCWNLENLEISAANLVSLEYMGHPYYQPREGVCLHNFPLLSVRLVQSSVPLQSVRLVNVNIKDEMIEYLLFNCRHLEELCIKGAKYLSNLNIASASLKSLSICNCASLKELKINSAANLVSFEYSTGHLLDYSTPEFCFQDVPLLSELIINLGYMQSFISKKDLHGIYYNQLEKLVLNLPSQAIDVMEPDYRNFPRLRCLKQLELGIAITPGKSLLFCGFWAMACPFLSTFCIQLYEEHSQFFVGSHHENERKRAQKKLKLNSYRHKHLKVVKLIDFIDHVNYVEFAMDLLQIAKSLEKLIVVNHKNDPDKFEMKRDYAKQLEASLPVGAELVVLMH